MPKGNQGIVYRRPVKSDYGIGIIGAGGIVNGAHLPAYRKAGLNVVAICDVKEDAVKSTANRWGIQNTYCEVEQLLARPDVDIVDIAIPNQGRVEIVEAAAVAGKHILIQKPFAYSYEEALHMVQMAEKCGVKLAVNQNARWAPFYRAVKEILDTGVLGTPYLITHEMRINQDATMGDTWFAKVPHFLLVDYEIHHIDLMRYWSKQSPSRVYVSATKMPGQNFESEMTALSILEFPDGARATLTTVDTAQSPDHFWRFSIEGSLGSLYGTIHRNYTNPCIQYFSNAQPKEWVRPVVEGDWFPDAFYGSMFELMNAIQEDREPSTSGRDNLETIKVLSGMIQSIEERRMIDLD